MRVGLVAPCIGVGGGDALMLGLVNHCHDIEFTGVYVRNLITRKNYDWAKRACGHKLPPIHNRIGNAAIRGADIVMSWCLHSMDRNVPVVTDVPVIEHIQNSDNYAGDVVQSNKGISHFYSACSRTAAAVAPDGREITVIYNGIEPGRVAPRLGRERQRKLWNLNDKKILLYMGRFVKEKHPEMAVTCLPQLPEEWVTVFVGGGYQDTELYQLAQMIAPDRVFFVDSKYHVGDVLAAADVFVLPSDFEGHSLALCEAWLAGTPTVYTDFDAVLELEDEFGILGTRIPKVSPPQDVADAVMKAASHDSETLTAIVNARNMVWENFTLPRIAFHWEEYFRKCLNAWTREKLYGTIHCTMPRRAFNEV
jgi:glycosyltransferase involved in cell wall biosynthesis